MVMRAVQHLMGEGKMEKFECPWAVNAVNTTGTALWAGVGVNLKDTNAERDQSLVKIVMPGQWSSCQARDFWPDQHRCLRAHLSCTTVTKAGLTNAPAFDPLNIQVAFDGNVLSGEDTTTRTGFGVDLIIGRDKTAFINGVNMLNGLGGNDVLAGLSGNDTLDGGADNDRLQGGDGIDNDYISGSGNLNVPQRTCPDDHWTPPAGKQAVYASSTWGTVLDTNATVGQVLEWSGLTNIGSGTDSNYIDGGDGDDHIIAGHGNDHVLGGAGSDTITGLEGDNVLEGGHGNDNILADGIVNPDFFSSVAPSMQGVDFADDSISGGGRADVLYGGATGLIADYIDYLRVTGKFDCESRTRKAKSSYLRRRLDWSITKMANGRSKRLTGVQANSKDWELLS